MTDSPCPLCQLSPDEADLCADRDGYGIRLLVTHPGGCPLPVITWQVHSVHPGRDPFAVGRPHETLEEAVAFADERRASRARVATR